jgi:hypothetical protein
MTPETAELLFAACIEARRRLRIAERLGHAERAARWADAAQQLADLLPARAHRVPG